MKCRLIGCMMVLTIHLSGQVLPIPYLQDNKIGFCDTLGNILMKPTYENLFSSLFRYDATIKKTRARYLLKDQQNLTVVDETMKAYLTTNQMYDSIEMNSNFDYYYVFKEGKVGFVMEKKLVIPPIYDDLNIKAPTRFVAERDGFHGVIDESGREIIPFEYQRIWIEEEQANFIKWECMGKVVSEFIYDTIFVRNVDFKKEVSPSVGMAPHAPEETKHTLLKMYDSYDVDSYRYAKVKKNGLYGLYDMDNEVEIITPKYYSLELLFERDTFLLIDAVTKNGYHGIIDQNEYIHIDFSFDEIESRGGHMFELAKEGRYGIYTYSSVYPIIQPKYDYVDYFMSIPCSERWWFNVYIVENDGKIGLVGENGVEYFK